VTVWRILQIYYFGLHSSQSCFYVEVNLRPTVSRPALALVSGTHLGPATNFSFSLKFPLDSCGFVILWRPLWREDGSVIYRTVVSGPFHTSHSWVEVPPNSRLYFTVSSETPQPGEPGPRIYIPQEQGGPDIPPDTGFLFCRLLRLAGLRWRYYNPPPHGLMFLRVCICTYIYIHIQIHTHTHTHTHKESNEVVSIVSGTGAAICTAVVVARCNSKWQY
jgi:hypothetical protein